VLRSDNRRIIDYRILPGDFGELTLSISICQDLINSQPSNNLSNYRTVQSYVQFNYVQDIILINSNSLSNREISSIQANSKISHGSYARRVTAVCRVLLNVARWHASAYLCIKNSKKDIKDIKEELEREREREWGGRNVINTPENSMKVAVFRDVDSARAASGSPERASTNVKGTSHPPRERNPSGADAPRALITVKNHSEERFIPARYNLVRGGRFNQQAGQVTRVTGIQRRTNVVAFECQPGSKDMQSAQS